MPASADSITAIQNFKNDRVKRRTQLELDLFPVVSTSHKTLTLCSLKN